MTAQCPCQALVIDGKPYKTCCQPYHLGAKPANAEQLMRSRFSAYVLGLADYLTLTWAAKTCPNNLSHEPDDTWLKLEVIKTNKNQVEFKAFFKDNNGFNVLHETSDFILKDGHWLYVSGKTKVHSVRPERNSLCLCGSGLKYKKCCHSH